MASKNIPSINVSLTMPNESSLKTKSGRMFDWDIFAYPKSACEEDEGCWSIHTDCKPVLRIRNVLDFNQLEQSQIFFFQRGQNDEEAWIFIAKRKDGLYIYFNASCDYTGFDCRGGGVLMYTYSGFEKFWTLFLDSYGRMLLTTPESERLVDKDDEEAILRKGVEDIVSDITDPEIDIIRKFIGGKPFIVENGNPLYMPTETTRGLLVELIMDVKK